MKNNYKKRILIFLGFILFFPFVTEAFTLNVGSLESRPYAVGEEIPIPVNLEIKDGVSLNTLSAEIPIPKDVQFVRAEESGSLISFWIEKPRLVGGSVKFSGIFPGGFSGLIDPILGDDISKRLPGKVMTIYVRTEKPGTYPMTAFNIIGYRNDGSGEEVSGESVNSSFVVDINAVALETKKDINPPLDFSIEFIRDQKINDGEATIVFDARDGETGIDYYEIKEFGRKSVRGESPYKLQGAPRGEVTVRAYDYAGNFKESKIFLGQENKITPTVVTAILLIVFVIFYIIFHKSRKKLMYLFLATILFLPSFSQAATISVSPVSANYSVGDTFDVNIRAESVSQSTNAISALVSYPKDLLRVVRITKGSVLSFWVTEPVFSNTAGTIRFEGVSPNPGFNGDSGSIVVIKFEAIKEGVAKVAFSEASMLANDGLGTNILSAMKPGTFYIKGGTPSLIGPVVTSPTHPDQNSWYNTNEASFEWDLPIDATNIAYGFDKNQKTIPVIKKPAMKKISFEDVEEGVWYFHLRAAKNGVLGATTHFRVQTDRSVPIVSLTEIDKGKSPEEKFSTIVQIESSDAYSGVSKIYYLLDDSAKKEWIDDGGHQFETGNMEPGRHKLSVEVVDSAGNTSSSSLAFDITGFASPVIKQYPASVNKEVPVTIMGSTYPGSRVNVSAYYTKKTGKSLEYNKLSNFEVASQTSVIADSEGSFVAVFNDGFDSGQIKFEAVGISKDGRLESKPSLPVFVEVESSFWDTSNIPSWIKFLPIWVILIILISILIHQIYHHRKIHRQIVRDIEKAEEAIKQGFMVIKDDTNFMNQAKGKDTEEKILIAQSLKDQTMAEAYISSRISEIKKRVLKK